MKHIARFLLALMIFTTFLSMVGCSNISFSWTGWTSEYVATISKSSGSDTLNFEFTEDYTIRIYSLDGSYVDCSDVQIEYNDNHIILNYSYTHRNTAVFNIYAYELGSGMLKITYRGQTLSVAYNVVDYEFEANGYEIITSIDDLDKYPAFKEMILSLEYYEFKEPYIGLNRWEYDMSQDDGNIYFCYKGFGNRYMSTDYLVYLLDSVYYPAKFVGYQMCISLPESTDVSENASRVTMNNFSLSMSVSDPHHNKRSDSITGMYFEAQNIHTFTNVYNGVYIRPSIVFLERYPERFFQYKLGDITIYILSTVDSGAEAYFVHGDYLYILQGKYDFD